MEQEFEKNLENYLKNKGVKEIPSSNKEKLKLLKNIYYNSKVEIDIADLRHTKEVEQGIHDSNYISTIQNLELDSYNSLFYISCVSNLVREEKRMARAAKIKSFFKIK